MEFRPLVFRAVTYGFKNGKMAWCPRDFNPALLRINVINVKKITSSMK